MAKFAAQLFVFVFAASSLFSVLVSPALASIPKPSVPEFTLRYVDNSYDVSPTFSKDDSTGLARMVTEGYHVQNKTIELAIKNQRLSSFSDGNDNVLSLYYIIRSKGHFGDSWGYLDTGYLGDDNHYVGANQDSDYTVITYGLVGDNDPVVSYQNLDISDGGQADFQVQAFVGYYKVITDPPSPADQFNHGFPAQHYIFTGETSDWSDTQTVAVGTPLQTTLTVVEIVAICVIAAVVAMAAVVYAKKRKH